jgi:hypothetical protein
MGVLAAGAVLWTCSVYSPDLLSPSELTAGRAATETGGATSPNSAGMKAIIAGSPSAIGGTSSIGGTSALEGGAGSGLTDAGGFGGSGQAEGGGGDGGMVGHGNTPIVCKFGSIPPKASWHATASHSSVGVGEADNKPEYVMDLTSKQWSTGKAQSGDEWLQVDFGAPAMVRELTFTLNVDDAEDYPRIYQIKLSDTPLDFNGLIRASGSGALGQTLVVTFAEAVEGRYLLVLQKGNDASAWWSVSELTAKCF